MHLGGRHQTGDDRAGRLRLYPAPAQATESPCRTTGHRGRLRWIDVYAADQTAAAKPQRFEEYRWPADLPFDPLQLMREHPESMRVPGGLFTKKGPQDYVGSVPTITGTLFFNNAPRVWPKCTKPSVPASTSTRLSSVII